MRKILSFITVACVLAWGLSSCQKEPAFQQMNAVANTAAAAVTSSYTVHTAIHQLDSMGKNSYNYECSFWVTTNADTTKALALPGKLSVSYDLISGGKTVRKTIILKKGSYVTRQYIQLKSPVVIIERSSTPASYGGKPVYCKDTATPVRYNLSPIHVQGTGFADATGKAFIPWGVNYTNTNELRLMDDNWYDAAIWEIIKQDFREMKSMDLNLIRIHLQYNRFMVNATTPNEQALKRLKELVEFAGIYGLYLDITGLACYIKEDVPGWYDALSEEKRWASQAICWKAIAGAIGNYNNVFAYNLMNEPVTPTKKVNIWLPGDDYGGYYFVQYLTQTPKGRSWEVVTRSWIQTLKTAIREKDTRTPITVGFIGLGVIAKFNDLLDYNSAHLYPEEGKMNEAMDFVKSNQTNKPLVIEETSWLAGFDNTRNFINTTQKQGLTAGYLTHYHGETIAELAKKTDIGSAIQKEWYEIFCFELNPGKSLP